MTAIAKIFKNGQSQAVRLPKEFRFENQEELFVKKVQKDRKSVVVGKEC